MKDGRATEMVLSCHLLALHGVKRCGDVCTLLLQMMYVRFNRVAIILLFKNNCIIPINILFEHLCIL
jgi:hypothetical protein